jgi:diguanylate cyclase (GGDEF)-like protein/PAS domain S-box-containing protein
MQAVLVNIVILGLFVFLFGAITWERRDDRLLCWVGGWLCVLAHFAAELWQLWQPSGVLLQNVQTCVSLDTLALGAVLFAVSSMVLKEGRPVALRLGLLLAVSTLLCINLAAVALPVLWPLAAAVAARQLLAVLLAAREQRRLRPLTGAVVAVLCLITGVWMFYAIFHGQPEIVIFALLAEMFIVVAIDFWSNGWERTVALHTMTAGLVAWGMVFPVSFWMQELWPHFILNREIWNIPKFCVAVGMILVVLDEDTRAAHSLSEDYRLLFDSNPQALWITEIATRRFLAVNQAALDMHGYTREEFLALKLTDILHFDVREWALAQLGSAQPRPNRASRHIRKDGTIVPLDLSAYDIVFHGSPCRFVMAVDVTEREALAQRLEHETQYDHLTGLPNRMLFPELLAAAIDHAAGDDEKLAIICLDIDRFKRINDTFGMRVGDECIQRVAAILTSQVRAMDIVARTGGEEFTIVLTGIGNSVIAEQTAYDLQQCFAAPLVVQGFKVPISLSMGLGFYPNDGTDPISLWRSAERAQLLAKGAGGRQAAWLSPELSRIAEEQIELEAYMRTELEDGGFHMLYQPIYSLNGSVAGMEALLRLDHPRLGPISPARLIPIAEETGLIIPLGQWVIEEACRQLLLWKSEGVPLVPIAVNVSGLQLMHEDFARRLLATLRRYAIDPHWIHLEVTESSVMRNLGEVADQMAVLSAQGFTFSIDDFGTGHSSLGRLNQLRISVLKIDRSFINDLCAQKGPYSIVQAIITMAHALGHAVVAEGVETEQQLACLRDLNCDLLQGYLLSRPVAPDKIPALIAARHPAFDSLDVAPCCCNFGRVAQPKLQLAQEVEWGMSLSQGD